LQKLLLIIAILCSLSSSSQELFVNSEPASVLPARSLSVKLSGYFITYDKIFDRPAQRYLTELLIGVNKKLMLRVGASFSNMHTSSFKTESFALYSKYRFFSQEEIHRHFRMALFFNASYSYAPFHGEEVELMGDKTGIAMGLIATQLLNKFALSGSISHTQLLDSSRFNEVAYVPTRIYQAMNYSFSAGYLLFPRDYEGFDQLNVNLYMELLGQQTLTQDKYYIDLAPALQFIINSNLKLNISYRVQLSGNMNRLSENKLQFNLEKNFLNVWKRKKSN